MKTKYYMITLIVLAFLGPVPLFAQFVTTTKAEVNGRQLSGDRSSSKFSEYRDMSAGFFTNAFTFRLRDNDFATFVSLSGSNMGLKDQSFAGQFSIPGSVKVELEWNQIPHYYTNTARTIFSGAGSGQLLMPDLVQNRLRTLLTTDLNPALAGVQFDTLAITNLVVGSARGLDITSQRDKTKAIVGYSPTEEIDIKLQYTNERRSGTKPLGGNFSFNPIELVEPTVYRTQEATANIEYAKKDWNLQLAYTASIFDNDVDVLVWDNPFREVDAVGNASRGRIDLYPNNTAQNVSLSAGAYLPLSTRLMATASYGWRQQNDKFIPFTINTALDTVANRPKLPAPSLDGKVATTLVNIALVNRELSSLWFTVRYRVFDYDNQTPSLIFPGYVQTDNSIPTMTTGGANVQRRNAAIGYKKTNASVEATLRLLSNASLKLGYEREDWSRKHRDAEETSEDVYKTSLDYTPSPWLFVRSSYSFGAKKTPHYDWEEVAEIAYPIGEPPGTLGQLPQLRKFDMASRDRNKATIIARFIPDEIFTFTGSFGLTDDNFAESQYGLLTNKSNNFSLEASINPTYDMAFHGYYTRENFKYSMKSRQRSTAAFDTTNNDWTSALEDGVNTFGLGVTWAVIPEKVDFSLNFSVSDAKGTSATRALGNPLAPTFLVTTAANYPDTKSVLRQLRASLSYRISEHFTPRLEYRFDEYEESYFNVDVMEPYMVPVDPGASGGVFLGARQPGYSAHIIYLVLSYEF